MAMFDDINTIQYYINRLNLNDLPIKKVILLATLMEIDPFYNYYLDKTPVESGLIRVHIPVFHKDYNELKNIWDIIKNKITLEATLNTSFLDINDKKESNYKIIIEFTKFKHCGMISMYKQIENYDKNYNLKYQNIFLLFLFCVFTSFFTVIYYNLVKKMFY